jgi:protocatechuate 3,4-dioxygenase beta subunit
MTRTQKLGAAVAVILALVALLFVGGRWIGERTGAPRQAPGSAAQGEPGAPAAAPPAAEAASAPVEGVSLTPAGAARVVHEPALAHGGFAGKVMNWSTGGPVAGAQVTFDGESGAQTAVTDAEGRFQLEPPAPGRYELAVASAPGFLPFAPDWGHSPITLFARPGLRIADVTLFLRPAIDYTGVVEDPSGTPVAGASVRLLDASMGEQAQSPLADKFTSDAKGEFVFHAPDDALLEARHPNFGPGRGRLDGGAAITHRLVIKLSAKAGKDELGAASIPGKVISATGAPVAGALIRADHTDWDGDHPFGEARAGSDGKFTLSGLDAGVHIVRAICNGCASASARAPTGVEVTLKVGAGGALAGRVYDADGAPAPSFTVVVSRADGVREIVVDEATVVDAEGRFEIGGLEPGDYKARATAHGHAASPAQAVRVADEPEEIALRLSRGGIIFGKVIERGTLEPLGWARVRIDSTVGSGSSALPLSVSTVTDEKGEFVLTGVPPGVHSVLAVAYAHHMSMASGLRVEEGGRLGPLTFTLGATREGEEPKLELFGVGAKLKAEGDALFIEEALAGGGAQLAGLVSGDAIVKVDGRLVAEIGFQESIQLIRGPEGTRVLLGVRRADGSIVDVPTERRRIVTN